MHKTRLPKRITASITKKNTNTRSHWLALQNSRYRQRLSWSMYNQDFVTSWLCHVINVVHSAVVLFLSPDQLSGTRFHTNWETTVKRAASSSLWKHCSSVSISVSSALEEYLYTTMRYIKRRFTYFTYSHWTIEAIQCRQYICPTASPVICAVTQRYLRSANRQLLAVPIYHLNTYGRWAFSVAGPTPRSGTLSPDFIPDPRPSVQSVWDICLKRICSVDTSAFSTLEVLFWWLLYCINLLTYLLVYQ